MDQAREVASWSKDPNRKVGAALVRDRRLLAVGYNGFPEGIADSDERLHDKSLKNELMIHAEESSWLNCLRHGISPTGATCYIYGMPPCPNCTLRLGAVGIANVIYCCDFDETMSTHGRLFLEKSAKYAHELNMTVRKFDYGN